MRGGILGGVPSCELSVTMNDERREVVLAGPRHVWLAHHVRPSQCCVSRTCAGRTRPRVTGSIAHAHAQAISAPSNAAVVGKCRSEGSGCLRHRGAMAPCQ